MAAFSSSGVVHDLPACERDSAVSHVFENNVLLVQTVGSVFSFWVVVDVFDADSFQGHVLGGLHDYVA